ncbi:MAG: 3-hydroxyacyl-CoA dehydrogenase [Hyphomicrobiales bacterium]|nr:MAG: 3-hydroxyacyl-CoA dehydrogenase [Hyphomicrobiales bacterium]
MTKLPQINTITIVGAGLIGASWAAYYLSRQINIRIYDPAPETYDKIKALIQVMLTDIETVNDKYAAKTGNLSFHDDLKQALTGTDYVQENAPEKLPLKQKLLAEIDALLPPDILIGSSTSSLLCSDLQEKCVNQHRILVTHPFNPPHLIPLVELVAGKNTASASIDIAYDFYQNIGKKPIRVSKEAIGHVANRLTAALWQEAVNIVAEGIASVEDVDRAIANGPGLRWAIHGPHMLYHLGGGEGGIEAYLNHLGPAQEARWKDLGRPVLDAPTRQKLIDGVFDEANGQSLLDLKQDRDKKLVALLKALEETK